MKNFLMLFVVLFTFSFSDIFSQYNQIVYKTIWDKAEEFEYGTVLEFGDNLYVVVVGESKSLSIAKKKALMEANIALTKFVKEKNTTLKISQVRREEIDEGNIVKKIKILVEMPK